MDKKIEKRQRIAILQNKANVKKGACSMENERIVKEQLKDRQLKVLQEKNKVITLILLIANALFFLGNMYVNTHTYSYFSLGTSLILLLICFYFSLQGKYSRFNMYANTVVIFMVIGTVNYEKHSTDNLVFIFAGIMAATIYMKIFNIIIASGLSMFSIFLFFPLDSHQKLMGYNWTYPFYWNLAVLLCMFIAIIMVLFYQKQQREMERYQVMIEMQKAEMQYLLLKSEKKQR